MPSYSRPPGSQDDAPLVLLVDDDNEFRRLLARVLRIEAGLNVLECANALAALTLLESRARIALVVSDLRMPGLDGASLLAVVGERWPSVRRMLLSAWTTGEMVAAADYPVIDKALAGWLIVERITDLAQGALL